jgi:uncharacterized membrane protein
MASIRSFGIERIGALSDGVVAIAITLLILEIKIPSHVTDGAVLWAQLKDQTPELTAWLISFAMIALVWYDQHYLFAHSSRTDSGYIIINMLQLGAVTLIPLGAHLVGRYPEDALSETVFSTIMLLNGMLMALNAWYLSQHSELHSKDEARFLHRRAVYHAISFPLAAVFAFTVAVLHHPLVGTAVWLMKPLGYAVYHAAHNRYLDYLAAQQTPIEG